MSVIVLGIDPGTRHLGWGVVRAAGARVEHVAHGVIHTDTSGSIADRLVEIDEALALVLRDHTPRRAAVESIFFSKDAQAAAKLGHARGVVLLALRKAGVEIAEYPPASVKRAIVGRGAADKRQVALIIAAVLRLSAPPPSDAADALAIAITHARASVVPDLIARARAASVRLRVGWCMKAGSREGSGLGCSEERERAGTFEAIEFFPASRLHAPLNLGQRTGIFSVRIDWLVGPSMSLRPRHGSCNHRGVETVSQKRTPMTSLRSARFVLALALAGAASLVIAGVPSDALADDKPAAPSTDDIAAKVQAFYNQTKTFQAQFSQVYKVKAYNQTKKSQGRVIFEKPGKMSWSYDSPNGNRVVSDGKTLKVYEKDNNQMFEQPVEKSQYPAALSFLMGQGDLSKSFNLKALDAATMKFEGGYVLEGTPKEATPAYQKVLFYIDRETAQVRRVIILDAQGNRNEFTFKSPTVNTPVPAGTFDFTPPPGTQIVHPLAAGFGDRALRARDRTRGPT